MAKRMKQAALVLFAALVAAQFIRPDRTSPATDESGTIDARMGSGSELVAVLNRACADCHSNATAWPWYSEVAPLSWLMAYGVREGRKAVNFSEWAAYAPDRQVALLAQSCRDVRSGKMPGAYALVRPETRLSPRDIEVVCAAARQVESGASRQSRSNDLRATEPIAQNMQPTTFDPLDDPPWKQPRSK